ncbi:MAG: ComEA family DNA-binding protein [Gammaproteobacteria bacterium]|nr:ComEA family DNA-binding protein [Gammaproteobacteria bacterium]
METLRKLVLLTCLLVPTWLYAADTVNINTADKTTLMEMIKGIGEKKAEAIIAYREKHGPFRSVDELAQVSGIGEATVEKNRDKLTTGN